VKICSYEFKGARRLGFLSGRSGVADATLAHAALLDDQGKPEPLERAVAALPADMVSFLERGREAMEALKDAASFIRTNPGKLAPNGAETVHPAAEVRFLAPVPRPGKILCGVLSFRGVRGRIRTWEDGGVPDHPFYFSKATSAVIGQGDAIEVPDLLAWPEVELAWVISRKAKNISAADFRDFVVGFTVFNDVTAGGLHGTETVRYFNPDGSEGLPFRFLTRYKGYDTFAPMGPWIVTEDEIDDPNDLAAKSWVGKVLAQDGSTNELTTKCESLTEYISSVHTLFPGDIISGGTCSPAEGRLLRDNDLRRLGNECRCEIEKVGLLVNPIKPLTTGPKKNDASVV